jgi:hypothetical protein
MEKERAADRRPVEKDHEYLQGLLAISIPSTDKQMGASETGW